MITHRLVTIADLLVTTTRRRVAVALQAVVASAASLSAGLREMRDGLADVVAQGACSCASCVLVRDTCMHTRRVRVRAHTYEAASPRHAVRARAVR